MNPSDSQPQPPRGDAAPSGAAASRELQRLLSALADDALTDDEFSRLDQLLRDDPQARKTYAQYVDLCGQLGDLVVPSMLQAGSADSPARVERRSLASPLFDRPRLSLALACAAALALVVTGVLISGRPEVAESPVEADGDEAVHVAVITGAEGAVWAPGSAPVGVGASLGLQTLRLTGGRVEVDFGCGAKINLRGPAEFSLLSANRGVLRYGDLSAAVPDEAEGFVIDTPSVEVVDLGTEFGVSVSREGVADVHVFKGAVEARTTGADEAPGALFRLATRQTRRFAPNATASTETAYRADEFPPLWVSSGHEPKTRGAVRLLRHPPASVEVDTLESNDFILLFKEQSGVALSRPLPVTLSEPGRYIQFRGRSKRLPAGTRVSSYLLHFDALPINGRQRKLRLDGSVTFSGPILGVIAAGKPLLISDMLLGHPQTLYGGPGQRGLDSRARDEAHDIVTLSDDRRTLDVSFFVRKSSDQLRVLIAAPESPDGTRPRGFGI